MIQLTLRYIIMSEIVQLKIIQIKFYLGDGANLPHIRRKFLYFTWQGSRISRFECYGWGLEGMKFQITLNKNDLNKCCKAICFLTSSFEKLFLTRLLWTVMYTVFCTLLIDFFSFYWYQQQDSKKLFPLFLTLVQSTFPVLWWFYCKFPAIA